MLTRLFIALFFLGSFAQAQTPPETPAPAPTAVEVIPTPTATAPPTTEVTPPAAQAPKKEPVAPVKAAAATAKPEELRTPKIGFSCAEEIKNYCGSSKDFSKFFPCLVASKKHKSDTCANEIHYYFQNIIGLSLKVHEVCKEDVEQYCKVTRRQVARDYKVLSDCLSKNYDNLSITCIQKIEQTYK